MVKRLFCAFVAVLATAHIASAAAIVTVSFDSGGLTMKNSGGSLLSGGTTADGNGAVLQLGYYSNATTANNFAGTWVPLTGEGSLNTAYKTTSIGDNNASGGGDGTFFLSVFFQPGDALRGNSLPSSTSIPLSIRFYNATSISGSTEYNVISNDLWLWKTPAETPTAIAMSLSDAGAEWLGGANSALRTTLAVPEPSAVILATVFGAVLATRRRRAA